MKRKYFKPSTKILLTRDVKSDIYARPVVAHETTLADANLSNDCGTIIVDVELHPDEYINFNGCNDVIRWDGCRPYLNMEESIVHGYYYENGECKRRSMFDNQN